MDKYLFNLVCMDFAAADSGYFQTTGSFFSGETALSQEGKTQEALRKLARRATGLWQDLRCPEVRYKELVPHPLWSLNRTEAVLYLIVSDN